MTQTKFNFPHPHSTHKAITVSYSTYVLFLGLSEVQDRKKQEPELIQNTLVKQDQYIK